YDPGDEFKSPPTWKGNYKFQLAVFPGGPALSDGDRGLAVYIHLLGTSNESAAEPEAPKSLALRITLLNREDVSKSINWFCTHTFIGAEKSSWGCPHLIGIDQLRGKGLGWLDEREELALRASVTSVAPEGSNPSGALAQPGIT
ncbi:hypothetical protein FOZ63_014729, partial [Perkinsus olseni]